MQACYDVCVVGAGLTGSAAAKWLSLDKATKVCLIGPPEPTEQEWAGGDRQVFGAHYDEGRVTREYDEDYIWALLAQRSIQEYTSIEAESGIKFYEEVGSVFVADKSSHLMADCKKNTLMVGAEHEIQDRATFQAKFPYLHLDANSECIWTPRKAGYINPRRLIEAQHRIAVAHGCDLIRDVVIEVTEKRLPGIGDNEQTVRVITKRGREIRARRVLLCTGSFTNYFDLLPPGVTLDINLCKNIVVKAEMTADDVRRMSDMPSILLTNRKSYALPPIKYPDGKYYLKMGKWFIFENEIENVEAGAKWFRSKAKEHGFIHDIVQFMKELLPDMKRVSLHPDCCIATVTPTGQLYCDMVTPRVGVLTGMNGLGAKSSNEIGRMGARLISKGCWDYDLPAELFKLRFKTDPKQAPISKL